MSRPVMMLLALATLSCNEIADINEPIPRDGARTPATTPTTPGTSPSGSKEKFLGTWTNAGGTLSLACPEHESHETSGQITITTGDSSDLEIADGDCRLLLDVSGAVATLRSNQRCRYAYPDETYDLVYASGTFTLDPGGTRATAAMDGTVGVTDNASGANIQCQFELNNPFAKTDGR